MDQIHPSAFHTSVRIEDLCVFGIAKPRDRERERLTAEKSERDREGKGDKTAGKSH